MSEPDNDDVGLAFVQAAIHELEATKRLAERAIAQVSDADLHVALHEDTNSIAVIAKHIAGNLLSRWTDFLTTDGEKPWRNRDEEFVDSYRDRAEIIADWNTGWNCLFTALNNLSAEDLGKTVTIRGVPHTVPLALQRSLGHCCYHIGQIVQIARIQAGQDWQTLTIAKGESERFNQERWGRTDR